MRRKKRLNNGQTLDVMAVRKNGKLVLRNAANTTHYELNADYGHLAHAHCVTSYASQGKTVDEVFISQPASTFPATDAKQFYVSVPPTGPISPCSPCSGPRRQSLP